MFLKKTSLKEFRLLGKEAKEKGKIMVPVMAECLSDYITPVNAYRSFRKNNSPIALLESVNQGAQGRYSIIALDPFLKFKVNNGVSTAEAFDEHSTCTLMNYDYPYKSFYSNQRITTTATSKDPLQHLQKLLIRYSPINAPGIPCFTGGAIGYFSYEAIKLFEPEIKKNPVDDLECPDVYLYFYNKVVIFDHVNKVIKFVVNVIVPQDKKSIDKECYDMAMKEIKKIKDCLEKGHNEAKTHWRHINQAPIKSNMTKNDFIVMVEKAKELIEDGEIFQVVLSQRFYREFSPYSSFDFYRLLRHTNPSPYMFHIELEENFVLVGASPEVMVRINNGEILIRPIAGTRKRGKTKQEDEKLAHELSEDKKEKAEHEMLVDLARNDVGRFSKIGSVKIDDMLRVEYYSHVMHLVTDVRGTLRSEVQPFIACLGSLPAGTLSGAPKIRAMQIISELEPSCRGPYGGLIGWITSDSLDSCIFIRSAVIKNGKIYWQTGAGIVADSKPANEYDETIAKALAIERVLDIITKRR